MRMRDSNLFRFVVYILIPLIILVIASFDQTHYYTGLVNQFGIYIILVASLNLVNGFSGMFSMGHAAFMAIGAYAAAYCTAAPNIKANFLPGLPLFIQNLRLPMAVGMMAGGLAAMLVAIVVGFCVLRMKGHYLSVATLGLIVIVRSVLDNADAFTNGARGLSGLPAYANTWTIFLTALAVLYILFRIIRSGFGRELIAQRDDYTAARTTGVKVISHRIFVFALSAFFAGVGGALWGHMQSIISGKFYYYDLSFRIVQISIIGGMYTLSGSIVGSLFMVIVPKLLQPLEQGFRLFGLQLPEMYGFSNLLLSAFLVALIIVRRQGMVGFSEGIVESIFSLDTYKAPFRAAEYNRLGKAFLNLFCRKKAA